MHSHSEAQSSNSSSSNNKTRNHQDSDQLLQDESKPKLQDWFSTCLAQRRFNYEFSNRSEGNDSNNNLSSSTRDDNISLNYILNQVLFQNDHRKPGHHEKYLNLFFDFIEHSGKKNNNSIFCEGVVIVGGMKSWRSSSEFYNPKSSRNNSDRSQCNFHIEEVFWLSPSDSKLAPCPLFNRLNLERVNAKIIDEYKVDTTKRHNKEEYYNDFLFAIVVDSDRNSETITLSRQFEEKLADFVTFPIHTLLSTQPPCYNSRREREEVLNNHFNSLVETKSWFIDPLESHILLERIFKEPPQVATPTEDGENNQQTSHQKANRANELIQQMQSSWLDENLKNTTENYQTLRKQQDSRYSVHCVLKGVEHAKQKNFEKALDCYHDALHYDEKNIDAILGIGSALYNQKQYNRALDQFTNALHIDPNHEIARQYLEKTRAKLESLVKEREQQNRKRKLQHEPEPHDYYHQPQRMHHQHYSSRSYDQNDHHSQTTNSYAQSSTTRPQHPDRTMSRASNFHPPSMPSQQLPQPSEKLSVSTPPSSRGVRALESTLKKILNSPEKKTKR